MGNIFTKNIRLNPAALTEGILVHDVALFTSSSQARGGTPARMTERWTVLEARDAVHPRARVRRDAHRTATPVVQTMRKRFVLRVIVIVATTCIVTWSCIGAALYFQEPPPPSVLDREDD